MSTFDSLTLESSPLLNKGFLSSSSLRSNAEHRGPSKAAKAVGVSLCLVWVLLVFAWTGTNNDGVTGDAIEQAEILRFDHVNNQKRNAEIARALLLLKKKIHGRVYFHSSIKKRSHKKQEKFKEAAATWRQNLLPPLAVIEAHNEKDVALALPVLTELKEKYDFPFRIRSGGHNKAGYSTVAGGAVLSLSKMNDIILGDDFDVARKRRDASLAGGGDGYDPTSDEFSALVTISSGTRVADFTRRLHIDHNYSGVTGVCSGVAEGGFVMGGGFGFYSRKYGLGSDSVERMRVVLANGTIVEATKEENKDLFWAMRGGGSGNFGVMVEMDYRVHPIENMRFFAQATMPMHLVSKFLFDIGEMEANGSLAREFLIMYDGYSDGYREKIPDPRKLQAKNGDGNPGGANAEAVIGLIWIGDFPDSPEKGQQYIKSVIEPVLFQENEEDISVNYFNIPSSIISAGPADGWGKSVYASQAWCGFLYPANNTAEVWKDIHGEMGKLFLDCPDLLPDIELWGGAINDLKTNESGFGHRGMIYNVGVLLMVQNADMTDPSSVASAKESFEKQSAKVDEVWPSIAKYLNGAYVNYPMSSLRKDEYPSAYWGENLPRLSAVKRKFDPSNAFSYEQSIPMD